MKRRLITMVGIAVVAGAALMPATEQQNAQAQETPVLKPVQYLPQVTTYWPASRWISLPARE